MRDPTRFHGSFLLIQEPDRGAWSFNIVATPVPPPENGTTRPREPARLLRLPETKKR